MYYDLEHIKALTGTLMTLDNTHLGVRHHEIFINE